MSAAGLDAVLPLLACPHCAEPLTRHGQGVVGCGSGHRFDVARQGYLSLLGKGSRTDTGDTADMVDARARFLGRGHYRSIAHAIADAAATPINTRIADSIRTPTNTVVSAGPLLEIGAGTGYYLAAALDRLRDNGSGGHTDRPANQVGIAVDASRYAARRAAAAHRGIGSVVADAWSRLPVQGGVVSAVLSVFAPRDPAEIARVLTPGGLLVVVTPEPEHLSEIRGPLGLLAIDPGKPERLATAFSGLLQPVHRTEVRHPMRLNPDDLSALVRMGPSAHHVQSNQLREAIADLGELTEVSLAVTVSVFRIS